MTTKSEHAKYLASEHWQKRRKLFLTHNHVCSVCRLPRWMSSIGYDQDLNVHHRNYQNLGDELDSDLQALCRRCHEIETFGKSDLKYPCPVSNSDIDKFVLNKSDTYMDGWNDAIEWTLYMDRWKSSLNKK